MTKECVIVVVAVVPVEINHAKKMMQISASFESDNLGDGCWKSFFLPSLVITVMVDTRCNVNSCLTDFTKEVGSLIDSLILKHQSAVTLLLSDTHVF